METTIFNELEYYNAEIVPIMEKLQEACKEKGLPYVCSVVYKQDQERSGLGVFMENNTRQGLGVLPLIIAGKLCKADLSNTAITALLLTVAKLLDD
jgi:hypothetical protein